MKARSGGSAGILPVLAGILPASIRQYSVVRQSIPFLAHALADRLEAGQGGQMPALAGFPEKSHVPVDFLAIFTAMTRLSRPILAMSLLAFFGLTPSRALDVGTPAPDITAIDQDGATVSFADVYKKGTTLVYFYPKADTPGCTKEACSLRDSFASLSGRGLQVLGVSEDKPDAQKKFQAKYHLPFTLIADHDGAVAKAFGVPTMMGIAKRQSFLVQDGKIVWADLKASTSKQAADVAAALDGLAKK